MRVKTTRAQEESKFQILNKSFMSVEGPDVASATNIREQLEAALLQKYKTSLEIFFKNCTMNADSAVVMERVGHESVSSDLRSSDETSVGCMVHFLNNPTKNSIASCHRDSVLQIVIFDFKAVKKKVEDENGCGRNKYHPDEYSLIQEVEICFSTHYMVAECSLKYRSRMKSLFES